MADQLTKTYVIAVKREKRDEAPADLLGTICARDDVSTLNKGATSRVVVEVSAEAAEALAHDFGDWVHIEELTRYRTQPED